MYLLPVFPVSVPLASLTFTITAMWSQLLKKKWWIFIPAYPLKILAFNHLISCIFLRKFISWNWVLPWRNLYSSPTGWVPAGHKSCGTELMSPWQNQFHDIEFLEEAFSDITVLNFSLQKIHFWLFCQFGKNLWNQLNMNTTWRKMKSFKSFISWWYTTRR